MKRIFAFLFSFIMVICQSYDVLADESAANTEGRKPILDIIAEQGDMPPDDFYDKTLYDEYLEDRDFTGDVTMEIFYTVAYYHPKSTVDELLKYWDEIQACYVVFDETPVAVGFFTKEVHGEVREAYSLMYYGDGVTYIDDIINSRIYDCEQVSSVTEFDKILCLDGSIFGRGTAVCYIYGSDAFVCYYDERYDVEPDIYSYSDFYTYLTAYQAYMQEWVRKNDYPIGGSANLTFTEFVEEYKAGNIKTNKVETHFYIWISVGAVCLVVALAAMFLLVRRKKKNTVQTDVSCQDFQDDCVKPE